MHAAKKVLLESLRFQWLILCVWAPSHWQRPSSLTVSDWWISTKCHILNQGVPFSDLLVCGTHGMKDIGFVIIAFNKSYSFGRPKSSYLILCMRNGKWFLQLSCNDLDCMLDFLKSLISCPEWLADNLYSSQNDTLVFNAFDKSFFFQFIK